MSMEIVLAEVEATKTALAELRVALTLVKGPAIRVSDRTQHIIWLGQAFLAGYRADSFWTALGFKPYARGPAPKGSVKSWRRPVLQATACRLWIDWRAFTKRPSIKVSDKVYNRFVQFFSDNWPSDLEWPRQIPRPTKSKEAA